jgi:uncharacterized protein
MQMPLSRPKELSHEGEPSHERPDPDNPPWGIVGALLLLFLSFALMLASQLAFLVPYIFWRGVKLDAVGEFAIKDPGAIFVQIASIIPAHLLTLGTAWLLVTRVGKYPFWKTLGWERDARLTFWRSAGLAIALLVCGYFIVKLAEHYTGPTDNALERLIQSSRAAALATAFAASFTAPLVEEIVFRGLLYSALRRLAGAGWAVSIVLLLFALIHVPQYWPSYGVIATILMLSFVLTMIRARTGKLLPCFLVHFIFNSIQAVVIVLMPYLERLSPAPPAPAPGLLLGLLARFFGA